jgi:hypothetical protein
VACRFPEDQPLMLVILGGPTGTEQELCLSMGYRGRHDGGLMTKAVPRPRGRGPQPSLARPLP